MKITIEEFKNNHSDVYDHLIQPDLRENNNFLQDVYNHVSKQGEISIKQINGIRNSMLYYLQKIERENLKEFHKDDEPTGSFVGKVRKRYDMTLKYVSGKSTSRGFYIHNFVDRKGNSLMCFSDSEYLSAGSTIIGENDCFTCRGTVNRHQVNDFDPTNKIRQTVLNRIKYNQYLGNKNDEE